MNPYQVELRASVYAKRAFTWGLTGIIGFELLALGLAPSTHASVKVGLGIIGEPERAVVLKAKAAPVSLPQVDLAGPDGWNQADFLINPVSLQGSDLFVSNTTDSVKVRTTRRSPNYGNFVPFESVGLRQPLVFPKTTEAPSSFWVTTKRELGASCPTLKGNHYQAMIDNKANLRKVYDISMKITGDHAHSLFMVAVVATESQGDIKAESNKRKKKKYRAKGACQFMDPTAKSYGVANVWSLESCVPAMIRYYTDILGHTHIATASQASAAYNAGPTGMKKVYGKKTAKWRWVYPRGKKRYKLRAKPGKRVYSAKGREATCYPVTVRKRMTLAEHLLKLTPITPEGKVILALLKK